MARTTKKSKSKSKLPPGTVRVCWKDGSGRKSSRAEEIQDELTRIAQNNVKRKLVKEDIVEEAANPGSPLHDDFEWDDSKAGHQYRLTQANTLLAKVHIISVDNEGHETGPVRAWVHLVDDGTNGREEAGFESVVTILSDEQKRERYLSQARKELEEWRNRYQHLEEFSNLFRAIERVLEPAE